MYVDDSGMDEEDRYGAVVRDTNKYMPPALRKQFQQEQQQQTSGKAAAADHKAEKPPVMSTSPLQNLTTSNLPKAMVISPSPVTHLPNAAGEKVSFYSVVTGLNKVLTKLEHRNRSTDRRRSGSRPRLQRRSVNSPCKKRISCMPKSRRCRRRRRKIDWRN